MSNIVIHDYHGYGDCDDCGSYETRTFAVYEDGKRVLADCNDGHFGDGPEWLPVDGDSALLVKVLKALGHEVELKTTDGAVI